MRCYICHCLFGTAVSQLVKAMDWPRLALEQLSLNGMTQVWVVLVHPSLVAMWRFVFSTDKQSAALMCFWILLDNTANIHAMKWNRMLWITDTCKTCLFASDSVSGTDMCGIGIHEVLECSSYYYFFRYFMDNYLVYIHIGLHISVFQSSYHLYRK